MDRSRKYLIDILAAIELIERFMGEISDFETFNAYVKTQSAVERQLGIIGEALSQLTKLEPAHKISHTVRIIGLGNRLIHGYDSKDNSIV